MPAPPETETVEITRRKKTRDGAVNDTGLRFDHSVPVRVIDVAPPAELAGGEVIATHSTFRLAQRRASYEVLEYRCPVIKTAASAKPQTTPVPGSIFTASLADISFLAGLLVDKFAFHIPLYRQHQRLAAGGIQLARATLTQLVARTAALLTPIHAAQLAHVLDSRVLAMDESVPRRSESAGWVSGGFRSSCTVDEGRPLDIGVQARMSNHLKLRGSRALVVSVEEKVARDAIRYESGRRTQVNHCRRVVNVIDDVKTGEFSLLRDECGQGLLMGRMASGMEVA